MAIETLSQRNQRDARDDSGIGPCICGGRTNVSGLLPSCIPHSSRKRRSAMRVTCPPRASPRGKLSCGPVRQVQPLGNAGMPCRWPLDIHNLISGGLYTQEYHVRPRADTTHC